MPLHNAKILLVVAVAAVGIAGLVCCDDAPRTTAVRAVEDPWALVQGSGPVPVIVRGRPAASDPDAVSDAVFRSVEKAVTWTATPPFVRGGAFDPGTGMRLVFVFGGGGQPCAGTAGSEPPAEGPVTLLAALCDGPRPLARVDGRVGRIDGLDDHRLRRLVGQATIDLLAPPAAPKP